MAGLISPPCAGESLEAAGAPKAHAEAIQRTQAQEGKKAQGPQEVAAARTGTPAMSSETVAPAVGRNIRPQATLVSLGVLFSVPAGIHLKSCRLQAFRFIVAALCRASIRMSLSCFESLI